MYKILLIDDHPISREGIAAMIGRKKDLEVCGEAENTRAALDLIFELKPDLIVTDINMPGPSGLELIKDCLARDPSLLFLVVSMHDETLYAERILHAGAKGYLMKKENPKNIIKAIYKILKGEIYLSDAMSSRLLKIVARQGAVPALTPLERLSDREFEIFQLVGAKVTSLEIAEQLKISPRTVDAHRANIKQKLSLGGINDVTRYALNWVETGDASSN